MSKDNAVVYLRIPESLKATIQRLADDNTTSQTRMTVALIKLGLNHYDSMCDEDGILIL